jgi:hypothetical protein
MRKTILLTFLIFSAAIVNATDNEKIEKKLYRLLSKGKLEKCTQKAKKYRTKYPKSELPYYYLSKVYVIKYTESNNNKIRLRNLKQSIRYADKLSMNYLGYQTDIKDSLLTFITSITEEGPFKHILKDAISFYEKNYGDTCVLQNFFIESNKTVSIHEKLFETISDSLRWKLTTTAETLEGIAYHYSGEKPETGFDCSGFTKYVYEQAGIELPHNAQKQSQLEGENKTLAEALPGDLVFFGYKNDNKYRAVHAGIIYSIENEEITVVHCVSGGVSIDGKDSSFDRYWKDRVLFVKSLPELK